MGTPDTSKHKSYPFNTQTIKKFFAPIFRRSKLFRRLFLVSMFRALYGFFQIYVIKYITSLLEQKNTSHFTNGLIILACTFFAYHIISYIVRHRGWAETYYQHKKLIHETYMRDFVSLDNNTLEGIGTGKIIAIIEKGIDGRSDGVINIVSNGMKALFTIVFGCIFTYQLGIRYGIGYLAFFALIQIFITYINKFLLFYRSRRRDADNNRTHQLVKMIMSKYEILISDKIDKEIKVLDKYADEATHHNIILNRYLFWIFNIPKVAINILRFGAYTVVGYGYLNGLYTLSEFGALVSLLILLDSLVLDTVEFYKNFTKDISDITRFWELFDETPTIHGYNMGHNFIFQKGAISLQNTWYAYGKNTVFENFSIDIQGGVVTALVGVSGSGKSTLIKLIAGYISPQKGDIIIDEQNLKEIKLKSYYTNIGYLTQEPSVFDGSILENLVYGTTGDVSQEKLDEAIKLARCEFIYQFEHKLETQIGEKGIRLSGGQRQRLAIAKLFLKNPQIILLDEPTSALDSLSEQAITQAFHNLFKGRTVIIIAHRLQTVKDAQDIIVFDEGKIIERGNHMTLSTSGGSYQKMLELQSGFMC